MLSEGRARPPHHFSFLPQLTTSSSSGCTGPTAASPHVASPMPPPPAYIVAGQRAGVVAASGGASSRGSQLRSAPRWRRAERGRRARGARKREKSGGSADLRRAFFSASKQKRPWRPTLSGPRSTRTRPTSRARESERARERGRGREEVHPPLPPTLPLLPPLPPSPSQPAARRRDTGQAVRPVAVPHAGLRSVHSDVGAVRGRGGRRRAVQQPGDRP